MIDWAVAANALRGEKRSGDGHVVKNFPGGVLVAVLDGLGHGEDAGHAVDVGSATLKDHAEEPVDILMRLCHDRLRITRGVAMTLVSIDTAARTMTCLGVGNVEGHLVRARGSTGPPRETVLLRGGVVGYRLPPLRTNAFPVGPGDTLILATDGVRAGFWDHVGPAERPQQAAERILAEFGRATDDALVLVARIMDGPG